MGDSSTVFDKQDNKLFKVDFAVPVRVQVGSQFGDLGSGEIPKAGLLQPIQQLRLRQEAVLVLVKVSKGTSEGGAPESRVKEED